MCNANLNVYYLLKMSKITVNCKHRTTFNKLKKYLHKNFHTCTEYVLRKFNQITCT